MEQRPSPKGFVPRVGGAGFFRLAFRRDSQGTIAIDGHNPWIDEALASLDTEMRITLLGWIDAAVTRGAAVLVSTHEIAPFEGRVTRTIRMDAGRLLGTLPT